MTKSRKERRAEAVERIRSACKDGGRVRPADVVECMVRAMGYPHVAPTDVGNAEIVIDLLSEDRSRALRRRSGRRSGIGYECMTCGYGVSDLRWSYCPRCGGLIVGRHADEDA